jgi:zinc D-Ala-D-Ala dipeptidase
VVRIYGFIINPSLGFYINLGFVFNNYIHGTLDPSVYVGMEQSLSTEFVESMSKKYEDVDSHIPEITHKILSLPIVAPEIKKIKIEECGEPLIDIFKMGHKRIVSLAHFGAMYDARHDDCGKVRKGLYERLLLLLSYLPESVGLAVFEGYRPLWKQKEYFIRKFKELVQASIHQRLKYNYREFLYDETCKFVSPFIDNVPVHCTGGAIDFMLFAFGQNNSMELLDLGKFGVVFGFNDQAKTLADNLSTEQIKNRKMLLDAAARAGLVNYGEEWWHYSYGDRAWAYVENKDKAMYGLALAEDMSNMHTKNSFLESMIKSVEL